MDAESMHLFAISLTDQLLTAVEENTADEAYEVPLILYLVAAKLRAAADSGGNGR